MNPSPCVKPSPPLIDPVFEQLLDDQPAIGAAVVVKLDLVELAVPELLGTTALSDCKLHLFTRLIKTGRRMCGCGWVWCTCKLKIMAVLMLNMYFSGAL